MAAIGQAESEEARYGYFRAVLLHPQICGDLAPHLLVNPDEPVGHGHPQENAGTGRRALDTDRDAMVEAPTRPHPGRLHLASRLADTEVMGDKAGEATLVSLPR